MASLLGAFNAQLIKFMEDIGVALEPEDAAEAKRSCAALKLALRMSPTMAVVVWIPYSQQYAEDIQSGDIQAFIKRDYTGDLRDKDSSWLVACEKIRHCAGYMSDANQQKTMRYVQLLTRLAQMYQSERSGKAV